MTRLGHVVRVLALASFGATTACGSDADGDGSSGASSDDSCGIAVTVSGVSNESIDIEDIQACITSTSIGAYLAFAPPTRSAFDAIILDISTVEPGMTATAVPASLSLDHEDGTNFEPMGCSVDIGRNSFEGTDEYGADNYRVEGTGSCAEPGVVDTRSISVVGLFRFVATLGWQN
jgi:hypothetical protein